MISKKKNSICKDIIQIEVDLPPFPPVFDKFIFDKVLIMLTSLPPSPRIFDKNHEILGFETNILYYLFYFLIERHRVPWLGHIE